MSSQAQQELPEENEDREDDGPESEAKDRVDEEPSNHWEDDIWPGVAGVERCELCCRHVQCRLYLRYSKS